MLKKNPARLPALCVLAVIIIGGGALVRSSVRYAIAEQHAAATSLAVRSAHRIERHLEIGAAAVRTTALDLSRSRPLSATAVADADAAPVFWIPDAKAGGPGLGRVRHLVDEDVAREWAADLITQASSGRATELLGPKRSASGEWITLVGSPMQLGTPRHGQRFSGWIAASLSLDEILRAADVGSLVASGFDYQLACLLPGASRSQIVARSSEVELVDPVVQVIHGTDDRWIIALAPRNGWIPWRSLIPQSVVVVVFALFGALVTADVVRRPERIRVELATRDDRLTTVHRRLADEIQQREALETEFSHASYHDVLTGLANRRLFMERLGRALQRARQRPAQVLGVVAIRFDRLKNLNDSMGSATGEELLVHAVRRVKDLLASKEHVIARLADDELGLMLVDLASADAVRGEADRIQEALADPLTIDGQSVFPTACMGIALSTSGYETADELVRGARIALTKTGVEAGTRIAVFDPATREQIVTRQQLETDLHQAIEREEFFLTFHPIVSLSTGTLTGMETLVRWRHPLDGIVPPAQFIPLAEETGLIVPMTRWILREACRQARVWQDEFRDRPSVYLSVNLSAQDLRQPDLCAFVASSIEAAGLAPGVLRLELTESTMIGNINEVSDLVSELRAMHVPILLDDFGTGYSSLSYLNRFKFDYLKIDRSFVSRMTGPDQSAGIVRAIVHLAQDLGIQTIAEGVETAEHCERLLALGCDYGQGYHYSKPVQADQAEALIRARKRWEQPREVRAAFS